MKPSKNIETQKPLIFSDGTLKPTAMTMQPSVTPIAEKNIPNPSTLPSKTKADHVYSMEEINKLILDLNREMEQEIKLIKQKYEKKRLILLENAMKK